MESWCGCAGVSPEHSVEFLYSCVSTYLERYQQGNYEAVWAELTALGSAVRDPGIMPDALDVAHETMRRAAANVDTLIARLRGHGYRFGVADGNQFRPRRPHCPPSKNIAPKLARLERLAGPVPLSLRAWYEVVGEVYLGGIAPWLDTDVLPDPLVVNSIDVALYSVKDWHEEWHGVPLEERPADEPCQAWIAPDEYHKEDISGGPPYSIALPNAAADARVEFEWHNLDFVPYLREAFSCGGFPGLTRVPGGLPAVARDLSRDLLPL